MIVLTNSIFYDIPKTGGSWVLEGLVNYKIGEFIPGTSHKPPDKGDPDMFSFTFIRHPVDWYKSYYASRVDINKHEGMNFDAFAHHLYNDGPELFEQGPWKSLSHYLKPFLTCDFIGKTESLADDLTKVLDMQGEKYDKGNLLERPRVNVSISKNFEVEDKTRKLIEKKESDIIKRYYNEGLERLEKWAKNPN